MMPRKKARPPHAQLNRMSQRWPALHFSMTQDNRHLIWSGPIRGFQMSYRISVFWNWVDEGQTPIVFVRSPKIRPRVGETFESIPHLMFDPDSPEDSGLCLFDPEGREWNTSMLIADTTVPWASEWIHHYECWHLDGVWRGANAPGPISVAEIRSQNETKRMIEADTE